MNTLAFALSACLFSCVSGLADDQKLTIYMGGKPFASETYSVQKTSGKIQVDGSGKAELGTLKVDIERFTVVTDDNYRLVSASAKATMGQAKMADDVTFAEGTAKNTINTGPEPKLKEDPVHPDAIVVNSNLPLFPWSLLALRVKFDPGAPQQFYAYIIGQHEAPVTVTYQGRESVEFADKKADLHHVSCSVPIAEGQPPTKLEFWLDDDHKIIKIAAPAQGAEAYQEGWSRKAPPAPAKPETEKNPPQ